MGLRLLSQTKATPKEGNRPEHVDSIHLVLLSD